MEKEKNIILIRLIKNIHYYLKVNIKMVKSGTEKDLIEMEI